MANDDDINICILDFSNVLCVLTNIYYVHVCVADMFIYKCAESSQRAGGGARSRVKLSRRCVLACSSLSNVSRERDASRSTIVAMCLEIMVSLIQNVFTTFELGTYWVFVSLLESRLIKTLNFKYCLTGGDWFF